MVPIAPWEAALGTKIAIPTLKDKILLTIPPASQATPRIKGKGLASKQKSGDLYAILKVVMPLKVDEKTHSLWQQLAEAQADYNPRKNWENK